MVIFVSRRNFQVNSCRLSHSILLIFVRYCYFPSLSLLCQCDELLEHQIPDSSRQLVNIGGGKAFGWDRVEY